MKIYKDYEAGNYARVTNCLYRCNGYIGEVESVKRVRLYFKDKAPCGSKAHSFVQLEPVEDKQEKSADKKERMELEEVYDRAEEEGFVKVFEESSGRYFLVVYQGKKEEQE